MTRVERLAPLAGLLAAGLIFAEFVVAGTTPTLTDSPQDVVSYFRDNGTQQEIASGLFGLAAVALIWFGATLRETLQTASGRSDALGSLASTATAVIGVWLSVLASLGLAAAHSVGKVPASVTQTLNVQNSEDVFVPFAVGATILLLATATAVLRDGPLPRWSGWLSLALGILALVALIVGALASPGVGFLGFLSLILWTPVVSILIYNDNHQRRQPRPVGDPAEKVAEFIDLPDDVGIIEVLLGRRAHILWTSLIGSIPVCEPISRALIYFSRRKTSTLLKVVPSIWYA
jgi:hypothetical protein